jgi:hypothetical protein
MLTCVTIAGSTMFQGESIGVVVVCATAAKAERATATAMMLLMMPFTGISPSGLLRLSMVACFSPLPHRLHRAAAF